MPIPLTPKRYVVEAHDPPYAGRAGDAHKVLPFFMPLEHFDRKVPNTTIDSAVFPHLPHS